jgi:hypothetical protein
VRHSHGGNAPFIKWGKAADPSLVYTAPGIIEDRNEGLYVECLLTPPSDEAAVRSSDDNLTSILGFHQRRRIDADHSYTAL